MPTVNDVVVEIEKIANPKYAFEWDNCGLLVGNRCNKINKVLITLDITKEVVLEAKEKGCEMIISHHPLIFKAVKNLNVETYEGEVISELYKNDISLYCAHTSLDICKNGVNDSLCEKLQLKNVIIPEEMTVDGENISCARMGSFLKVLSKNELLDFIKEKTGATNLSYNLEEKEYKTIALCTGSGEEYAFILKNADVFLTGEIKYHTALEMKRQNISFIGAGHYFTEVHIIDSLAESLQKSFNMVQYDVEVVRSETNTNPFEN